MLTNNTNSLYTNVKIVGTRFQSHSGESTHCSKLFTSDIILQRSWQLTLYNAFTMNSICIQKSLGLAGFPITLLSSKFYPQKLQLMYVSS